MGKLSKLNNRKLKIVAATSMTIFSLLVLFMGTFAWFSLNTATDTSGASFRIGDSKGIFKKLYIHELNESKTTESVYKFNKIPSGTISKDLSTGVLTPDFEEPIEFSIYSLSEPSHPMLFIFEYISEQVITTNGANVVITGRTDSTFLADGELDGSGHVIEKIQSSGNPLSSIIKFKGFSYPKNNDPLITDSTAISTYVDATETFDYNKSSLASMDSFVDFTYTGDEMEYDDFHQDVDFFRGSVGDHIKYVAVIFDYNEEALDYIFNFYLGNDVLDQEVIPFVCDWNTLV